MPKEAIRVKTRMKRMVDPKGNKWNAETNNCFPLEIGLYKDCSVRV